MSALTHALLNVYTHAPQTVLRGGFFFPCCSHYTNSNISLFSFLLQPIHTTSPQFHRWYFQTWLHSFSDDSNATPWDALGEKNGVLWTVALTFGVRCDPLGRDQSFLKVNPRVVFSIEENSKIRRLLLSLLKADNKNNRDKENDKQRRTRQESKETRHLLRHTT